MKLTEDQIKEINDLIQAGFSSREVASKVGVCKSSVNNYRNKSVEVTGKEPKILVYDLETAAATALTFGRFKVNLGQDNIIKEGGWILCASWTWLGSGKIESIYLSPEELYTSDDFRITATLHELYSQADAVVAHNGKSFDHPLLQARCIANNLPALPSVKVLDTLLLAKKNLRVPSNSLDSLAGYFGLGSKVKHSGISLWKDVQNGDEDAMKDMVYYCEQDVRLLEHLYLKIRQAGRAGSDFNAGLYYNDDQVHCRTCGSTALTQTGRVVTTALSKFNEVQCNTCGSVHRLRESITTSEDRKLLIV